MKRKGLLIFDLDGTLFRTETVTIPAVQRVFRERGLPIPPPGEIRPFFGRPTREFYDWIRASSPEDDGLVASVFRTEHELISKTGQLFPEVHEVLSRLRGMVQEMAICSNGTGDYIPRVIEVHGLGKYFDLVVFRGDSETDKPRMVRGILERLQGRPGVVVGDRQDDIEAARENGLAAIATLYGYGSRNELKDADAFAESPVHLVDLIPQFLGKDRER